MFDNHQDEFDLNTIEKMSIISQNQVRMANLSVVGSHKVNGVSSLHSDIIKKQLFGNFARLYPNKFTNVTNGIAYRRWLCQSNPELTKLLDEKIGPDYRKDASKLIDLLKLAYDEIKVKKKELRKK